MDLAFAYTGRLLDSATGLQNNLNRWYDASIGRWLSEDPIGFSAGDVNLYRYVGNGPVNGTDPSGLDPAFAPGIGIGSGFYRKDPVLPIDGAIQEPQYIWVCLGAYGAVGGITFGGGSLVGGGVGKCATTTVSRWGRPGLESGDWVMKGPVSIRNYVFSGKWQPGLTNRFAWPSSGEPFVVPGNTLRWPGGFLGPMKGAIGQRIYIGPGLPLP